MDTKRGCPRSHEMTEGYPHFLGTQIFFQTEGGCPKTMNLKIHSFGALSFSIAVEKMNLFYKNLFI